MVRNLFQAHVTWWFRYWEKQASPSHPADRETTYLNSVSVWQRGQQKKRMRLTVSEPTACRTGLFGCDNKCIPSYRKCDRYIDCTDGADEVACDILTSMTTCEELWEAGHTKPGIYLLGKLLYIHIIRNCMHFWIYTLLMKSVKNSVFFSFWSLFTFSVISVTRFFSQVIIFLQLL